MMGILMAETQRQADPASKPELLSGVAPDRVETSPFAHLVLQPALVPSDYAALAESFPKLERIAGTGPYPSNKAVRLNASEVLMDAATPPIWRDFFSHHVSGAFWRQIVRLFGDEMRRAFPTLEKKIGKAFEDWVVVRRGDNAPHDLRLDCQFVMNTPVTVASSVKGAHIDIADKIFSALLYFRDPADASHGGDLELYRWRREPRFIKHKAFLSDVERVKSVPYAANTYVAFVNSPQAVHGVSPRAITPAPRRYINFIAELPSFFYDPPQAALPLRLWHRLTASDAREEKY